MFIEPRIDNFKATNEPSGWIEVICGSMFSGKTEELIRRMNRAIIARQNVEIFKPAIDTRFHETKVVSHNDSSIRSTPVQSANDILSLVGDSDVVGIDEAQFFDSELIVVSRTLANNGKRVIIAGLDMDFAGDPFGPMPSLMSIAKFVDTYINPFRIVMALIVLLSFISLFFILVTFKISSFTKISILPLS